MQTLDHRASESESATRHEPVHVILVLLLQQQHLDHDAAGLIESRLIRAIGWLCAPPV